MYRYDFDNKVTNKQFIDMVIKEINYIKTAATPEEIGKLDVDFFSGHSSGNCIYGQMTGRCNSDRAKEIYSKDNRCYRT